MQKLKRNINIGFRVNPEEQTLIRNRMSQSGFRNMRAYLLKMAVCGYVINIDLSDVRECSRLLRFISNNTNQIARKANENGGIYSADIADIQSKLSEVCRQQNQIILGITKVLKEV
ncbi:MAG: MobC family plasmid mobilization relaxosome protein [Dehalococcoidia bacterium]|nr:MobC family plasmid mobilization relaxosome protein [Dehalococcoidia bacterium]